MITLRTAWRDVTVVGEIGRFDLRGGHGYFTLKDKAAALPAIMFSSDLQRVPFRLEPGLEVVARGSLDLYAPQGKFQIKVHSLEPVGRGALQLAFEQLKARLQAEGLFAAEKKRPIPRLPRAIAVLTSPTGAVVRDILHVLSRRYDGLSVTVYPVRVQGELAAAEIVAAGSVHVYGTLRGRVLAGAFGNDRARIFCRKLQAELMAIDGHYVMADDIEPHLREACIQACLKRDALEITTLD